MGEVETWSVLLCSLALTPLECMPNLKIMTKSTKGGVIMAENFACVACGEPAEKDDVLAVQECRVCRRMHCDGCLNEEGLCVECTD